MSMMRQNCGNEIAGAYRENQMKMEGGEIKLHSFLTNRARRRWEVSYKPQLAYPWKNNSLLPLIK